MITLVDTSVWVDHLRRGNQGLVDLLNRGEVLTHSMIIGELYLGNIPKRDVFFGLMRDLPQANEADHEEVLTLCDSRKLYGRGIGFLDAHILSAALLSKADLWTLDKRLLALYKELAERG